MARFDSIVVLTAKARGTTLLASVPLKRLRKKHPGRRIICVTQFPELLACLPYIDDIFSYDTRGIYEIAIIDNEVIDLTGTLDFQPNRREVPRHLVALLCERAGVSDELEHPECHLSPQERAAAHNLVSSVRRRPELKLGVFTTSTSTPNKEWRLDNWVQLIGNTSHFIEWVHLGLPRGEPIPGVNYLRLQPREDICVIGLADCVVTLDTFMLHAAATQLYNRNVIVLLGSTRPECVSYPEYSNIFHLSLDCQPCCRPYHPLDVAYSADGTPLRWPSGKERGWECPHVECMDLISVREVEHALKRVLMK